MRRRDRSAAALAALFAAISAAGGMPAASAGISGALASDSLLLPTETFVLTREDLAGRNVHTVDDIIALLPGVFRWREGPPGAYEGFSVEGRSSRGANFLVNGHPVVDPYRFEALLRILPLSRIERIEVVYSGSPAFTGDLSSRGAVNLVLEEGGREAPSSLLEFTFGEAKRRARRAWFATPRAHVGGVFAYDEYLQDGIECIPTLPGRIVGTYDSRSILAELWFEPSPAERISVRFHRYEDTSVGTIVGSREDVRWSGFASLVSYRRSSFEISVRERLLKLSRQWTGLDAISLAGSARWSGSAGPVGVRAFATVEGARFENEIRGAAFSPSFTRVEGGAVFGGALPSDARWRFGAWGGYHDEVGAYSGGEVALGKAWSERVSQDIVVARRLRLPSAQELYQPAIAFVSGADTFSTAGNADLSPEISDEISLGLRAPHLSISLFGRSESSLIRLDGGSRAVYRSTGSGLVAGVRARVDGGAKILGVDCAAAVSGEGYPEREALADGVPSRRLLAEIALSRRILGGTELLSAGLAVEFAGKRSWPAGELPSYRVLDFRASLTIMSARVSFELRNLLDESYETAYGYTMPGRYYTIGIFWELFD